MKKSEIHLLDVNVLVALVWPNHVHHDPAHRWFSRIRSSGWATCSLTESAFIRVSSNKGVIAGAGTPGEAADLMRRFREATGHVFWEDDVSPATSSFVRWEAIGGSRQVTDAHLLALAIRRQGRLASFDPGFTALLPEGSRPERHLTVIPVLP